MDNFNWSQFTKRIYITSDLQQIYDYWTKSENLEKWFLSKAEFLTPERIKISPYENVSNDSIYRWNWFAQNHLEEGKVISVNNTNTITFTFAGNCIVTISLTQEGNQTIVELRQSEIPDSNAAKENIRLGCAFGWTFYLLNLKSILEGGIDLRNKNTELKGVVNN